LAPVLRLRLPAQRAVRAPVADAAAYFDAVAGELRRGAALRQALAIAAPQTRLARLAATGQPMELVAAEVQTMFTLDDELAAAGIQLAGRSGAPAAVLFSRLAERLRAGEQLARDRRTLTAQARLSAAVIGLLPVAPAAIMAASSRGRLFLEPGPTRLVVLFGFALQVLGLIVIGVLLRADR
jgi:Flp pilus assembly protein TadB